MTAYQTPEQQLRNAEIVEVPVEREARSGVSPPNGADGEPRPFAPPGEAIEEKPPPSLVPMPYVKGRAPPVREWTVPGWVPKRKVTLLQGDGGDGKSTLMQQLQSSCATALPWLGLPVEPCNSIGFYTEDEEQDLEERQAAIDAAYGLDCRGDETFKMHLFPRVAADDNELVRFDRNGNPVVTPFYRQACEAAQDLNAGLVAFDVAVDLYGGDEIKRRQVRGFFRPLGALARLINGSVALSSHVSMSAIRSDGGHSASTDWSNAARSRLCLSRAKEEADGQNADPDVRLLTRKKAQYAAVGDAIKLLGGTASISRTGPPQRAISAAWPMTFSSSCSTRTAPPIGVRSQRAGPPPTTRDGSSPARPRTRATITGSSTSKARWSGCSRPASS